MIMWRGDNFISQHQLQLALLSCNSCLHGSRFWAGSPDSLKQRGAAGALWNSPWLSMLLKESCQTQQSPLIFDNYLSSKVKKFWQVFEFRFAWDDGQVGESLLVCFFNFKSGPGKSAILIKKITHFISSFIMTLSPLMLSLQMTFQNMQYSHKTI